MKLAALGKSVLTLTTGIGLRDLIKRNKGATALIIILVVANEIRGLMVVGAIVKAWWQ